MPAKGARLAIITADSGPHVLIDTTDAANLCGVTKETIRQWDHRGQITAADTDHRGRKRYRLIDIAHAERATRQRAGRTPT